MKPRISSLTLLLLALAGCEAAAPAAGNKPGAKPVAATPRACLDPLQGARYRVCGRLSTVGNDTPGTGRWVVGSVDSSQENVSGQKYRLLGGTFHADR